MKVLITQYGPSTLSVVYNSIFGYLNSKDYGHNIRTSEPFKHSREVLLAKMNELKQIEKEIDHMPLNRSRLMKLQ